MEIQLNSVGLLSLLNALYGGINAHLVTGKRNFHDVRIRDEARNLAPGRILHHEEPDSCLLRAHNYQGVLQIRGGISLHPSITPPVHALANRDSSAQILQQKLSQMDKVLLISHTMHRLQSFILKRFFENPLMSES